MVEAGGVEPPSETNARLGSYRLIRIFFVSSCRQPIGELPGRPARYYLIDNAQANTINDSAVRRPYECRGHSFTGRAAIKQRVLDYCLQLIFLPQRFNEIDETCLGLLRSVHIAPSKPKFAPKKYSSLCQISKYVFYQI